MPGLAREDQPLELALGLGGVEDDQLVAVGGAREVAEPDPRAQVVLLAPHPLQLRREALVAVVALDDPAPLLALLAAPAPVQLEEHVTVEVGIDLVEVDLDLARAPERRLGDGVVGHRRRADRVVGRRRALVLGDRAAAQLVGLVADLRDQGLARRLVDQRVDRVEAGEGVLAVEDPGLVDLVGLLAVGVEHPAAEVAVDRRAADQDRELEPALVQLLDAGGHLLRGRDEQRREPDRVGLVLDRGVDDRVDRDLLAEVDDRVAVVGQDRVDQRLADVVDVAEHGRDHDLALGVALDPVEVVLELGDRALHHLGRLEHEGQDQLAGAELVADLLHRRQQDLVQGRDRADLLHRGVDPASTPSFLRRRMCQ